ncbi:metallophosphoesterase [Citricoccus sp. GCM10030269]|uniref:metallophosphoesterase n=1 Tax=Citricoccus sp. GCM10030269 TaxID=3273388 RepID=UPI0036095098
MGTRNVKARQRRDWLAPVAATTGALAATGAGMVAWGALVEARNFAVRTERLPILPSGGRPFRILHLSDIHLAPSQRDKLEWLSTLSALKPDLVVNTGDNIASAKSLQPLVDALGPLLDVPGVFVPGSNDYYAPKPANPLRYLAGPSEQDPHRTELPWSELFNTFEARGWLNLSNQRISRVVNLVRLDFAGTDDPHLGRDEWPGFPGVTSTPSRSLRIGVTHAPYRRVLDAMVDDGADLILAGHTHGGQICVPWYGALVTNCDLPTWQASGLTDWTHGRRTAPLEVSAGIGTSPKAPVRFACRPEAVVLDVVPRA